MPLMELSETVLRFVNSLNSSAFEIPERVTIM